MPKAKGKVSSDSDSDEGPVDRNPPPKKKTKGDNGTSTDSSTTPNQWTLQGLRQVRINEFRGRKFVDIREYYEKDGEYLPGKKGISLSITQWKKLLEVAKEVTDAVEN